MVQRLPEPRSLAVDRARGTGEQHDELLVEAAFADVAPLGGLGAGYEQQRRLHLLLDPAADQAEGDDHDDPADQHRHGVTDREPGNRRDQASLSQSIAQRPGANRVPPLFC